MAGIYMLRDEQSSNTPINYNELKILLSEAFEQHGIVKACRKNSFLFKEGDEPEGVYYICKGLIKVMQSTEEGRISPSSCAEAMISLGIPRFFCKKNASDMPSAC
jgi:hypothetical protein